MSICVTPGNAIASATLGRLPSVGYDCVRSMQNRSRQDATSLCMCTAAGPGFRESPGESEEFTEVQFTLKQVAFQQREQVMGVVSKEISEDANPTVMVQTLVLIVQSGQLLLGRKKRGYGVGKYNGFGGKVEVGETIEQAAIRELKEEAGIDATALDKRCVLTFHNDEQEQPLQMHVFHAQAFAGQPCESEEMEEPKWFDVAKIPYEKMWPSDIIWFPLFLNGDCFIGEFFTEYRYSIVPVPRHLFISLFEHEVSKPC